MNLYETIFVRRSVRKYTDEKINDDFLAEIKNYLQEIKQIDGQNAEFRILNSEEMGDNFAPYYIIGSCEQNNEAYANLGYVLEKMDLYLQSVGLGSVWLGRKMPKNKLDNDAIVIAFGKTNVAYRTKEDFNRLKVNKISNLENEIARVARLAPSAVNSQPWYIEFEDNKVIINCHPRGPLKAFLEPKMNKIDVGIITRFITIALENEGKEIININLSIKNKKFISVVQFK